jgi:zinc protease
MKKLIYFSILTFACGMFGRVMAQQTAAYDMMVDGVKVIVQPSGNDIVEIQTIIKGGVQNYPASKVGIESMAISGLTECGTLKHDKNTFKNQLEKISADVYGGSNKNYSELRLNCIKSDFDTAWPLYVEALTMPKFDAKEFERIKQDAINSLKEAESNPDAAIDKYAEKVAFAGRGYAKDPDGKPAIINKLTALETKAYYKSVLTKSRILIVIVADLDRSFIETKIKAMLAGIKQGLPFQLKKTAFTAAKNTFTAEKRDLATNYIEGVSGGPLPGTTDYNAFNMAMRIFNDRHFLEVRTNNGLSYSPGAWFSVGATSAARFSVATTEPNKYIKVFNKLVAKIRKEGYNADEVANMKLSYLTGFYDKNETNTEQAASMASNEVLHGNWRRSLTLVDDIKQLTVEQVNSAFRKYMGGIVWVYQGDLKKVNGALYL